jgi:3-hydroxyisobutyrate dehydrogenase-like beta-hydroxyacid dehydrogenase
MKSVGFIGLGIMGRGMVKNLIEKGVAVRVWNRTRERILELEKRLGVPIDTAESPRALAAVTDVVISCVSDPAAVESVVFGPDGLLAGVHDGFCHIESSTVSPALVRRVAQVIETEGGRALDAPVTGSRLAAEDGSLLFMTGGPKELHTELEPLLLTMGKRVIHCGPSGSGAVVKLAGNTMISYLLEGLAEAMVVTEKAGVAPAVMLEMFQSSGFASPLIGWKGGVMSRRDYDTHFSIDLLLKDQSLMLAQAAELGAKMPGLAAIHRVFESARAFGLGERDVAAVIEAVRRDAGLDAHT